jgi:Ca2+-binding RTX toxin-like protein
MGVFTGGDASEVITPTTVSATVTIFGDARPSNTTDAILGGAGNDTIDGGKGEDFIDGGADADLLNGGDGNDVISWSTGGGSDTVDGGKGADALLVNTGDASEAIGILAQAGHAIVSVDVGLVAIDVNNVERIAFGGSGGADRFAIGDLTGTSVKQVDVDVGAADGLADMVSVGGSAANDRIVLRPAASRRSAGWPQASTSATPKRWTAWRSPGAAAATPWTPRRWVAA